MVWNIDILADLIGSIAILGMLAVGYGTMRRVMPGTALAPMVLGVLFGGVAVLQMHMPISPTDGVIIDLRCIPIALAGAFLGLRGALICLGIAVAARIGIGGIGWVAGVASMLIAAAMGMLWNQLSKSEAQRGWRSMLGLGALMSLHMAAILLLPSAIALWFVANVLPLILALNLLTVPVVALLLERERLSILREAGLRAALSRDLAEPLPEGDQFADLLARAAVAPPLDGAVSVLGLRLRGRSLLTTFWGAEVERHVMAELGARLSRLLPEGGQIGLLPGGLLVAMLPALGARTVCDFEDRIRREVAAPPIPLPGMISFRPGLTIRHQSFAGLPLLPDLIAAFARRSKQAVRQPQPLPPNAAGTARLFRVADRLFDAAEARSRGEQTSSS